MLPPRPVLLVTLLSWLAPQVAHAAPPGPERRAVQERKYGPRGELRLGVGSMPLNPFAKGWTLSLSHTHHFDDMWSWETIHVTGALLTSTSLRDELIDTFARLPREFAAPRLVLTTGLEISPLYGKQVLFNRDTVHSELSLGVYGGVMVGDRDTLERSLEDVRPSAGTGLGIKVYLSRAFSTRFDARVFATLRPEVEPGDEVEIETVALLTLSIGLGFGDRS